MLRSNVRKASRKEKLPLFGGHEYERLASMDLVWEKRKSQLAPSTGEFSGIETQMPTVLTFRG
jgi:hypothetical protein